MIGKGVAIISGLMFLSIGILIWFVPEVMWVGKLIIASATFWGSYKMFGMLFDTDINWD